MKKKTKHIFIKRNKTKKIRLMKGNGKYSINQNSPNKIKPHIKKVKGTKRAPSINYCHRLNDIYKKWESIHDKLFNDMNLTFKERISLQDRLAKQIIIHDLNITASGNYKKYEEFMDAINGCNNIDILQNLSRLLQQIQTADSIPFDVINAEIKQCKYKGSCRRQHPIHKLIYHNPNFFTLHLIETIDKKIERLNQT